MNWQEIKEIAAKRTKIWDLRSAYPYDDIWYTCTPDVDTKLQAEIDGQFSAMIANNFDKIAAIVDAARSGRAQLFKCNEYNCYPDSQCQKCKDVQNNFDTALEELEK